MIRRAIFSSILGVGCILPCAFLGVPAGRLAPVARGSVSGTVTDAAGSPVPGAQISLEAQEGSFTSDEKGQFVISGLVPGSYVFRITNSGSATWTRTVDVIPDRSATVVAQLQVESENQPILLTSAQSKGRPALPGAPQGSNAAIADHR